MALGPELVQIRDGCFSVGGSAFPVVGANNYYLAYASDAMRGNVIAAAAQLGLNVLRAWAFLDCEAANPGEVPKGGWGDVWFQCWDLETRAPRVNEGETGLIRLDRLIADAEQADIRLILPLVNQWPDFGGMDRYVKWFGAASRDQFYRDARLRAAYQSYVAQVLTRRNTVTGRLYQDEPAILAWELANEPECDTRDGRDVLLGWVRDMSQWVKRHDPNHLLAVGDQGYFAGGSGSLYNGSRGVDTEAFLSIPEIDFGTVHLYPQGWNQPDPILFGIQWIEQHLAAGRAAGKPVLIEEYGMTIKPDALPSALTRNFVYRYWLNAVLSQKGAGDLAWMIASRDDSGTLYPDYDHFTFYSADEAPAIRDHVRQMTQGATADAPPALEPPGENHGVVDLWVTDGSGAYIDETQTRVIVKRDGTPMGDPLTLDFSGGAVELKLPAFPSGVFTIEIEPERYKMCASGAFLMQPQERIFQHVVTERG